MAELAQAVEAASINDDDMTPDECLRYLTSRGVTVETREDRDKNDEVVPLRGAGDFCFLKIPSTPALDVVRHHGPVSEGDTRVAAFDVFTGRQLGPPRLRARGQGAAEVPR